MWKLGGPEPAESDTSSTGLLLLPLTATGNEDSRIWAEFGIGVRRVFSLQPAQTFIACSAHQTLLTRLSVGFALTQTDECERIDIQPFHHVLGPARAPLHPSKDWPVESWIRHLTRSAVMTPHGMVQVEICRCYQSLT